MKDRMRIITHMPLTELWDEKGTVLASRSCDLSEPDIRAILKAGPVRFLIADVGNCPNWIPIGECFDFWKEEIRPHLADPNSRIRLDDFPDAYAYSASEWKPGSGAPIVVLEMEH